MTDIAAEMIGRARRPLLYIGGGINQAGAFEPLRRLSAKNSIPVVATLMGLGAVRYDGPRYLGMLGMPLEHDRTVSGPPAGMYISAVFPRTIPEARMAKECTLAENKKKCPCPYTTCERHGACCRCVAYHRNCGDLPMCLR